MIWPFLLAISEVGWTYKKKCHLESGLNQRDEDAHEFSTTQVPVVPRSKPPTTPPDKEFSLGDMGTCVTENPWGVFVSLI